jgi:hypothetical protein
MSTRPIRPSGKRKGTPSTKPRETSPVTSATAAPANPLAHPRAKITEKSLAKAKAVFANFTLSKFPSGETPPTHVAPKQSVADVQRDAVSTQLAAAPPNGTMTFALTASTLKSLLPSYDPKKGTVSLDDVIKALESNRHGSEFYSNGNPTLNRLAVQSRASDIMASILGGGKK